MVLSIDHYYHRLTAFS